jgi:O-antigen/teichoic acid export membrane protein
VVSLKRNLVANYAGQALASVAGIIMLPVFVRYLGTESYGLVGFFTMLQSWTLLLDLGLTPTLARELARFSAGALTQQRAATMVRALEWVFAGFGFACAWGISLSANWIARHWLKAHQLSQDEVSFSIVLMGGMLGLQWLGGIYRAGLVGLERMVVLNIVVAIATVVRTVGSWLVLACWSATPAAYFTFQVAATVVEVLVFRVLFYRRFSMTSAGFWPQFRSLHGSRAMAGGMAFLATLWVVLSQADKLTLSWLLDLSSYGSFAVAVSLAGGINQLAAPMIQALQPRFVALAAQGQAQALEALYRTSTQLMTVGLFAIVGTMACFSTPLLLAWTGNAEVSQRAARILPLYALGNGIVALLSLAFAVQFAYGRLRWQIMGTSVLGLIWIPGGYLAARHAGAIGTGWVWLLCNLAYLLFWLSHIHARLLPGFWQRWLFLDVGIVMLAEGVVLAGLRWIGLPASGRILALLAIAAVTLLVAATGMLAAPLARRQGVELLHRLRLAVSR